MIKKAIILAAGKGTRFLPYTKFVAKEMLPIVDEPALELTVKEATDAGIEEICLVSSPEKTTVNDFARLSGNLTVVYQEKPLGTADAIALTEKFCDGQPAVIMNGDDLMYTPPEIPNVTRQLMNCFEKVNAPVIGVQPVPACEIQRYGSVIPLDNSLSDEVSSSLKEALKASNGANVDPKKNADSAQDGDFTQENPQITRIGGIAEKPDPKDAPSLLAALGRYVITPEIFDFIRNLTPNPKNGELILTDAFNNFAKTRPLFAAKFCGKRYDLGNKNGYLTAVVEFALRRPDLNPEFEEYLLNLLSSKRK